MLLIMKRSKLSTHAKGDFITQSVDFNVYKFSKTHLGDWEKPGWGVIYDTTI